MALENGNKYPSWKWLAITLASILILIASAVFAEMRTDLKQKVDKCQYEKEMKELKEQTAKDITEIKEILKEMRNK